MDYIVVGEILKPQGIKGEIKIRPLTDDPKRFRKLRMVYIDSIPYRITACRIDSFVYIKLDGVDTRNDAESFVGKLICIDRVHAVSPDDGSYFIVDLIGCTIENENGKNMGIVRDVDNYGAADVITAESDDKRIYRFPFLNRVIENINISKKKIYVTEKELMAVSVYED